MDEIILTPLSIDCLWRRVFSPSRECENSCTVNSNPLGIAARQLVKG